MIAVQTTVYGSSFFCAVVADAEMDLVVETDADLAEITVCGSSFFCAAVADAAIHFRVMDAVAQQAADAAKSLSVISNAIAL